MVNGSPLRAGERLAKCAARASKRWALLAKGAESVEGEEILEISHFLFEARVLSSVRCSNSLRAIFRLPPRIFSRGGMKRAQRDAICPSVIARGEFLHFSLCSGFLQPVAQFLTRAS